MVANPRRSLRSFIHDLWDDHPARIAVNTSYRGRFEHDLNESNLYVGRDNDVITTTTDKTSLDEHLGTILGPDDHDLPLYEAHGATRYASHQQTLSVIERNKRGYNGRERLITPHQYRKAIQAAGLRRATTGVTRIQPDDSAQPEDTIITGNAAIEHAVNALLHPVDGLSPKHQADPDVEDAPNSQACHGNRGDRQPRYVHRETPRQND